MTENNKNNSTKSEEDSNAEYIGISKSADIDKEYNLKEDSLTQQEKYLYGGTISTKGASTSDLEQEDVAEEKAIVSALSSWWHSPLDYEGKTKRKPFWITLLVLFALHIIALVPLVYFSTIPSPGPRFDSIMIAAWSLFFVARWIIIFFTFPMFVRRLRDAGFSPYISFLFILPFLGFIVMCGLCCAKSNSLASKDV